MSKLNPKQDHAFQLIKSGKSIFLTGAGGCGKTFLIKYIKDQITDRTLYVTALTGTASILLGGTTIHSWSGIADAKKSKEVIINQILTYNKDALARWRETDLLVIDEISMMSCEVFNKLNYIAMKIRNNDKFFGGIQLMLSGDFCQLPPADSGKFCFESETWKANFDQSNIIYLTEIFRQDNIEFQRLLHEIRLGAPSTETKIKLNKRLIKNFPNFPNLNASNQGSEEVSKIIPTILYPHHANVDQINAEHLDKLILKILEGNEDPMVTEDAVVKSYKCKDTFNIKDNINQGQKIPAMEMRIKTNEKQSLIKILDLACPFEKLFKYVLGAQVMLIINHDLNLGLVNGSRGVIIDYSEKNHPIVSFDNGQTLEVKPYEWILEHPRYKISRKQYPLILAWAITIHKSQGSTLSMIETDLSNVFAHGQAYVTLSRAKTLEGIYLRAINYSKIICNPSVKKFYQDLQ